MYNIDKELINKVDVTWNNYLRSLEENQISDNEWKQYKADYRALNGYTWYNDGKQNYKVLDFEIPKENWVKGFKSFTK